MADKKSFLDNPAAQFISELMSSVGDERETEMSPSVDLSEEKEEKYKPDYAVLEVKSRRLQLVLQPSLYRRVKAGAERAGVSVNEYCHQILDKAAPEEL